MDISGLIIKCNVLLACAACLAVALGVLLSDKLPGITPKEALLPLISGTVTFLLAAIFINRFLYLMIKKEIRHTLEQIDDTILNLIEKRRIQHFSLMEDTLLGKFQVQIGRLYDILSSYEERERTLRIGLNESISDIVHQINTPITNIRLYAQFLQDSNLDDVRRELFVAGIVSQSNKLSWLGESLSKVSRMETGIISLHAEKTEILPYLLEAIDEISLKAENHGNEILLKGRQDLKAYLDGKWTREVFYNLLDNAVKYSTENTEIIIELLNYEMYARIDFKNQGIPITKEEQALVFKRFYRSPPAADREGVGLGLYLVRTILEMEKGYVKLGSDTEGRTVFSVFLWKMEGEPAIGQQNLS